MRPIASQTAIFSECEGGLAAKAIPVGDFLENWTEGLAKKKAAVVAEAGVCEAKFPCPRDW